MFTQKIVFVGSERNSLNWETWRKRGTGLTIMAEFMKENNITIDMLLFERPDINIINALCWINEQGDKKRKSKLLLLKSHMNARRYYWRNWHHFQNHLELDPFVLELVNMNNAVNKDINIPKQL
ncbi:MAG: hypothetical protein EZS28_048510 [Streblomastix strix]|uniref:Uncharacterized protein n=1 Tax=Streblomastix strix TaxID=222440 RepID=A0A5J4TDX1_9EUKA|nr:MAG: hypothetical protein EZS28_048510 [Streblomastix strix]